jgi:hypothetical protein
MATCRNSSENTRKLSLQLVLNKNSPWVHMELELDMLGIAKKLVKYVVHLSKNKLKKYMFLNSQTAQIENDQFLVSRNFRD